MLIRSISRTEAAPMPTASARSRMRFASFSRSGPSSTFESSTPRMARASGGMTTAHATTGPARGPRPTSSTPASSGPRETRSSCSSALQRRGTARSEWCGLLRGGRAGLRHGHLGLPLLDSRRLAGEMAQVVELRAAHAAAPHDLDVGQHGAVEREDALDADAVGDLADREGRAHAGSTLGDAHAFERLNALLLTLLHADVHAQRVTGTEGGKVRAEPLFLGFDEGMHMTLGAEEPGLRLKVLRPVNLVGLRTAVQSSDGLVVRHGRGVLACWGVPDTKNGPRTWQRPGTVHYAPRLPPPKCEVLRSAKCSVRSSVGTEVVHHPGTDALAVGLAAHDVGPVVDAAVESRD